MKYFNTTGICLPEKNFMVDTTKKIDQILKMVYRGQYFIINRPRQYGKTTTLALLKRRLIPTSEYLPIFISFEASDCDVFKTVENFCKHFLRLLINDQTIKNNGFDKLISEQLDTVTSFLSLSDAITSILNTINKRIVLLVDEVDKSSNNEIFLHFIGMLRNKFLSAQKGGDTTFHSVILAGVHDIKNLKLKIRPDSESANKGGQYNSPWNIAVPFKTIMSFSPDEIKGMLDEYVSETGNQMDTLAISERIFFWTNGYPFLVSKLCLMMDEEVLPERDNQNWSIQDIENVVGLLLRETNTLFDDISKNLEMYKDLHNFIKSVVLGFNEFNFELDNPIISRAHMFGFITNTDNQKIKIHNRIFEEKITNYFLSKHQIDSLTNGKNITQPYISLEGGLDFRTVLDKFQEAVKEKYSKNDVLKSDEFLENDLRLLFMIYLKPIINGHGFCFKEVQTGEEKRLDLVVVYKNEKFVIELKLWRGTIAHKKGLEQLKEYMYKENVEKGYMLIMNKNKTKTFKKWDDKGIYCVMI